MASRAVIGVAGARPQIHCSLSFHQNFRSFIKNVPLQHCFFGVHTNTTIMANPVPANLLLFPIDIPQSPDLVSGAALFRAPAIFANQPINHLHREVFEAVRELETRRAAWQSVGDAAVTRWDIYMSQQRLSVVKMVVYQSEYGFGNAGLLQQLSINLNNQFSQLNNQFSQLNNQLTNMGQRLTVVEGQLTNMGQRLTVVEGQLTNMGQRLTVVEGQLQALPQRVVVCLSNDRVVRAPQEYEYIALPFYACMALPIVTRRKRKLITFSS